RRDDEAADDLGERLGTAAGQILQDVGEAAAGAEADDRRWRQRNHRAALYLAELGAERCDDGSGPEGAVLALLERLQGNDDERRIGLRIIVDEVQADDGGYVLDRVLVFQYCFRLPDHLGGPRDRVASGQLHDDEER